MNVRINVYFISFPNLIFLFMLDLFKGVDTNADKVMDTFINDELIRDFDFKIGLAKEYTKFVIENVPNSIPRNHDWWF